MFSSEAEGYLFKTRDYESFKSGIPLQLHNYTVESHEWIDFVNVYRTFDTALSFSIMYIPIELLDFSLGELHYIV